MFDLDKSGFISADELHEVLDPITKTKTERADWRQIISDIDENGDGLISFNEFKSIMIELIMGTADVIEYRKSLKVSIKSTAEGNI
jgi:Ca2+-binding EF-hand superfamily protein